MLKADGSIAVHADAKAYKPLNWMSPPCTVREEDGRLVATNPGGETLSIELHEVLHDYVSSSATIPGWPRTAWKRSSRCCWPSASPRCARTCAWCAASTRPTSGPVDLLCRDGEDRAIVVEVKRVGEIAGVEQLLRYQERLDLDPNLAPTVGMFVATRIKPQAKVFAQSRGILCVEIDLEELRAGAPIDLRLF